MARSTRIGAALAVLACALGIAGASGVGASHNIQRGLSLHYKERAERFVGRIKSDPAVCLSGLVTVHKIKRGPNPTVGSDSAASDGSWSVSKRARGGRFYATTPRYETSNGVCRRVRSPILALG